MMILKSTWKAAAVAGLVITGAATAQAETVVVTTALRTVLPGHVAEVTFDVISADARAFASVKLELVDAHNNVLARGEARVQLGDPLLVRWSGNSAKTQVRAIARFIPSAEPEMELRAAGLSVESWNPATNGDLTVSQCALVDHSHGSNGVGSGPVAICDDGSLPTWLLPNWSTDGPCGVEVFPQVTLRD